MLQRALPEEADELAAILRSAMRDGMPWLPDLHTPEEDRWYLREVVLPTKEVWVAQVEGQPVGFAAIGSRDGVAFLEDIYIAPEHQNKGFGSALFTHTKERRPDGFSLWVFQRNEGARRFYERHGCTLVRMTDGSGNEEREPDALYEWVPASS